MANELGLYQLFRNIVAKSMVIDGRFFILAHHNGSDINSSNFGEIAKDALDGLQITRKYPCMVILPPSETQQIDDRGWSTMRIDAYFLTTYQRAGDGAIKTPNLQTNLSEHTKEMDWKDMRECAGSFRKVLRKIIGHPPVSNIIRENRKGIDQYTRVTMKGNDNVNGIHLSFEVQLFDDYCEAITDYGDVSEITIPDFSPHKLHRQ